MTRPGYKLTEIGEIPEEWVLKKLAEVSESRREIVEPLKNKFELYVGLENITPGKIKISTFGDSTVLKSSKFKFYKSDILYGKLRPYLDKVAVAEQDGICSTDIIPIIGNRMDSYFLVYQLHSNLFLQFAISTISGTNHPRTSWEQISHFIIPCPPLQEQQKIAEILTTADRKIELIDHEIQVAEKLRKGLMQTLLTRGIGHTKFKLTEIGEIPEEWTLETLHSCCDLIRDGTHTPPKRKQKGVPLLSAVNVNSGHIDFENNVTYISEEDYAKIHKSIPIKSGDVLMTIVGTLGRSAIVKTDLKFTVQRSVSILRPSREKLNVSYFFYSLNSERTIKQLLLHSKATAQSGIYLGDISKITLAYPPSQEQQKIAEILTTADRKIELLNKKRGEAERLKKGLMQVLLTGQVRVKAYSQDCEN